METRERQDPRSAHSEGKGETVKSRERQETPYHHLPPSKPHSYLGMNLTSSPSRAWKSCQAWPELVGPRSSQSFAKPRPRRPRPPCRTRGSGPYPAVAGAGLAAPKPPAWTPRRAPRKPRANSWKVMAPSRSASSRWNTAFGVGRPPRATPRTTRELSRSRRPERLRRRRRRRSVAGPAPPGPHPPPSRSRGLRGAWPTSAAATVGSPGPPAAAGS